MYRVPTPLSLTAPGLTALALALALTLTGAGCTAVFGLEPTDLAEEPPLRDNDGDTIPNDDDNCVLVANMDQADDDGDALGNACDPCLEGDTQVGLDGDGDGVDDGCDSCLLGTNHDEDGDSLGDACDLCPGTADASQPDSDNNGIGDACDAPASGGPVVRQRVFFDGFGPPDVDWNDGFKPWHGTGDNYAPLTPAIGASSFLEGPWNSKVMIAGAHIRISASVIVPPPISTANEQIVGLATRQLTNGAPYALCGLRADGDQWFLLEDSATTPIPTGRTQITLEYRAAASAGFLTTTCTAGNVTTVSSTLYADDVVLTASLVANVAAEFEWVDVSH